MEKGSTFLLSIEDSIVYRILIETKFFEVVLMNPVRTRC